MGVERVEDGTNVEWVEGGKVGGDGCAIAGCVSEAMSEMELGENPSEFVVQTIIPCMPKGGVSRRRG